MRRRLFYAAFLLFSVTAEALPQGEDSSDETRARTLEELVVTATRRQEPVFDVPHFTTILGNDEIVVRRQNRTTPELLQEIPGVMVQQTGHGFGDPFIRGLTGFHLLRLVDGIRLNNSVFRSGPNQYLNTVDPFGIERLEVVGGPGSVLFGSDAVGGTINILTRERKREGEEFDWGGRGHYRFASAERSHMARAELGANLGSDFGVLFGATWKRLGELQAGGETGRLPNTGYSEWDGDFKVNLLLESNLELILAYQQVDQDDHPRTHSTFRSKTFNGTARGTEYQRDFDQRRDLAYVQVKWDDTGCFFDRAWFNVSYHVQREQENRIRANRRRRRQGFDVGTLGLFAQFESDTSIGELTYGFDVYHDHVDSYFKEFNADGSLRSRRPRGPVADDATYSLYGLYAQDEFAIGEDLDVILGARFTHARLYAGQVDPDPADATPFAAQEEHWSNVVGNVRALYRAGDHWSLYAGASQAFRAPNLSDTSRFDVSRSGELELPAPELDPETYLTLEAGFKTQYDWLEAQATYYYTFVDDMILRYPTGQVIGGDIAVTKDNFDEGFIHGVEGGVRFFLGDEWSLFAEGSWIEGAVDTKDSPTSEIERKPMSRIPPAMGRFGVSWEDTDEQFWGEAVLRGAGNQDQLAPRDRNDQQRIPPNGTPGYAIVTLRAGVQLTEQLGLSVSIENLFDKDYRVHGSGQNGPGLGVIIGLDAEF